MSVESKRHKQELHRLFQGHDRVEGTNQNGFSVFRLTDLEKGCVGADLDEIPFRVNQEETRFHAANLATQNKRGTECVCALALPARTDG